MKFSQCWVNFIIGWNSKSITISLGISQGIIAQLINSALEFVTERVQTGALGNQLFAGQFNFLADRANFLASWVNFLAVPVNLKLSKIGSFPRKIRQKQTKVSSCKISKTYQIVEITYTPTGYLAASGLLFKRKIIWNDFRNQQLPPHFIPTQLVWIYILDFSWDAEVGLSLSNPLK